jgi:hypothetical protein
MTLSLAVTFFTLVAATVGLALGRAVIVRRGGDDCLHLGDADAALVKRQQTTARRLKIVDAWGKPITALTVVLGLAAYVAWWLGA